MCELDANPSTRMSLQFTMAAPPTPVTSPGGPDTPEGPIILIANCAVVTPSPLIRLARSDIKQAFLKVVPRLAWRTVMGLGQVLDVDC